MALNYVLRRATSTVIPLAVRGVGSRAAVHGAAFVVRYCSLSPELARRTFTPFMRFSTAAVGKRDSDSSLIEVLHSEVECAEEDASDRIEVPSGFPFQIEDKPGERTITLTRKFEDETITVEVDTPAVPDEDYEDNDNPTAEEMDEARRQSTVPLVVKVTKGNGMSLEFGVTAFPDEVSIDGLSIKQPEVSEDQLAYEGPEFSDLDENLQKSFSKYLEIRGIKPSTTDFLIQYMLDKENREYLQWLKNLKTFVEK